MARGYYATGILVVLGDNGPMTLEQLAAAIGWKQARSLLTDKLIRLGRQGLVASQPDGTWKRIGLDAIARLREDGTT